ncbi:hypothetical protein F5Y05DRAFT_373308 [Hypoxylon sp. FL0543]|nr:hypothetical protein F5Y05DRAFT_373308 [Hypoxylon sp. FL0543]
MAAENDTRYTPSRTPTPPIHHFGFTKVAPRQKKDAPRDNSVTKPKIKLVGRYANYPFIEPMESDSDESLEQPQQELQPRLPRCIIVYMDGCYQRLHSIYDRDAGKYLYHHETDAGKPIEMVFSYDSVVALRDILTGRFIWVKGEEAL